MPNTQETFDTLVAELNTATNELATRIQNLINNPDLTADEIRTGLTPIVTSLNGLAQPPSEPAE